MKTIHIPTGYTTSTTPSDTLAIALFGKQGSGKTRFAMTAPDPIGIIPLDRKAMQTVDTMARELGKTIIRPKDDYIRVAKLMETTTMEVECPGFPKIATNGRDQNGVPKCCAKHYYRWHLERVKRAMIDLYQHPDVRTIVIDTGSQLWEDILFAHYGRTDRIMPRDRGPANQEMIDILNAVSGKNLIITHKAKEIWSGGDNGKPTGKFEWRGFGDIGYHVNVICEMKCDEKAKEEDEDRYMLDCLMCQNRAAIQGPSLHDEDTGFGGKKLLTGPLIQFPALAMKIFPESDYADWV